MVLKFDIDIDTQVAEDYRTLAETAPRTFQTFMAGTMRQHVEDEVQRRLAVTPGPAKQPIAWQTQKQKNYYFGFIAQRDEMGNILPYQRTGGFNDKWFVDVNLNNFSVGIGNSAMTKGSPNWPSQPLYNFLVGGQQQRFHSNTGWIEADDIILDIVIGTIDILADAWIDIMRFDNPL